MPWIPRFACPECHADIDGCGPRLVCRGCTCEFCVRDGIYRFLTAERAAAAAAFEQQYRSVRAADGFRRADASYYRALPAVSPDDPQAALWAVRRQSYVRLMRQVLHNGRTRGLKVLDLGAGSGWLSHRLAAAGHAAVAVDRFDDEVDGLGACRHYEVPLTIVQADFDALPFAPHQFDLAIFDASLHYAPDPARTLREARRMLAPGGRLVVMDSPMFAREADGLSMSAGQAERIEGLTGAPPVLPGTGYLTFAGLERAAESLGLHASFHPSRGGVRWRLGRELARLRLGRAPAAFGVWVAR